MTVLLFSSWRTRTADDPQLKELFEGFNKFAVINQTGTAALIDFFPVLRLLPDLVLSTQEKAHELHNVEKQLRLSHWMKYKNSIKNGTAQPCFCVDMAAIQESDGFSDDQAAYISGTLLEAGSDTTSSTFYCFFQGMVVFPEVQKKVQEELDSVVGKGSLLEMEDMDSLQHIRGCMKEPLRWMPTTIVGAVPDAVTKDDEYMEYLVSRGAGVLGEIWTIRHDPRRFPGPRRFGPGRYKDNHRSLYEAANNSDTSRRDTYTFGAGRRTCASMHVAERSLFLGISRLLWAFSTAPGYDQTTGKILMPDPERLTQSFVCVPEPYQAAITPRFPGRAERIRLGLEQAQKSVDPKTKQWIEVPKGWSCPRCSGRHTLKAFDMSSRLECGFVTDLYWWLSQPIVDPL